MLEPGAWDGVLEGKAAWSFHPPAANTAVRGLCSERVAGSWGLLGGQLGRLDYGGELRGLWGKPRGVHRQRCESRTHAGHRAS